MEEHDKPLGAPNLQQNTPPDSSEQNHPPKQKRKLNWKGFAIGIVAVIIIEFFAISMLNSPDPEIPIQPLTATSPTAQASPSTTQKIAVQTYTNNKNAYAFSYPVETKITISKSEDRIEIGTDISLMVSETNPENCSGDCDAGRFVENVTVDGIQGKRFAKTQGKAGGRTPMEYEEIVIPNNGKFYVFQVNQIPEKKQLFDQILLSFTFTNK